MEQSGYELPSLNEKLFLNNRGFPDIGDCLREYTEVRALWLQSNCITRIENLDNLLKLRSLFLHENRISKIEGLDKLHNLSELNISSNPLKKLENLGNLKNLRTLNVEKCSFNTVDSIYEVVKLKKLSVLNISNNNIDKPGVLDLLKQLPELKVLYLKGNPCVKHIPSYRKTVISTISTLMYLDDRPVFENERRLADAWAQGGRSAEQQERKLIKEEKDESDNRYHGELKECKRNAMKSSEVNAMDSEDICNENNLNPEILGIKREKLKAGVVGEAGQKKLVYIKTKQVMDDIDEDMESSDANMPTLEPLYSVQDVKFE